MTDFVARLRALRNNLAKPLENPRHLYFDPKYFGDIFERYAALRDRLKAEMPQVFNDLPVREVHRHETSDNEGRGYFVRPDVEALLRDIDYCLEVLEGLQSVELPAMKATREGVFFAGQYFDAYKAIQDILQSAKHTIFITDGYVNEEVLQRLTSKQRGVQIRILTQSPPASLVAAAQAFNKQYGGLSIRTSGAFHDRFIVIDDSDLFHVGASIKDAGARGFMFSRIEEPDVLAFLRKRLEEEWTKAKAVV